jgi:uncharacterized membrane protein YkvA (DUF1232 family)
MRFLKKLIDFIRAVAHDERIPGRDKKILLALLALVLSPIDIIPDWIPILGVLDDAVILAMVLDYLFNVLDDDIILSHYPWGMKSYSALRRIARFLTILTPRFIKNKIWSYEGSPYRR